MSKAVPHPMRSNPPPVHGRIKAEARQCFWISGLTAENGGYIPSVVTENKPGHQALTGNGEHARPWIMGATLEEALEVCTQANRDDWNLSPRETSEIENSTGNVRPHDCGFRQYQLDDDGFLWRNELSPTENALARQLRDLHLTEELRLRVLALRDPWTMNNVLDEGYRHVEGRYPADSAEARAAYRAIVEFQLDHLEEDAREAAEDED